ncbi:hypothetical protein [Tsuneonella sp. HG222]
MTILLFGGEMGVVYPSGSGIAESDLLTTRYRSAFARCAIRGSSLLYYVQADFASQSGDCFIHFDSSHTSPGISDGDDIAVEVLDDTGTAVIRIFCVGASTTFTWQLQYLNSSAVWTNIGSTISQQENTNGDFDIYANVTTGAISLFASGTERVSATGLSLGHIDSLDGVRFYSSGLHREWGQFVVADESTIGMRVATRYANGAGATSDWTGGYTAIDEIAYEDGDTVSSDTAGQIELFTQTGTDLTGYTIRAVSIASRAKRGSTGPQNMRHVLRINGSNFDNGSDIALSLGYGAHCSVWEQNPDSTGDWATADLTGLQFGVKAIA